MKVSQSKPAGAQSTLFDLFHRHWHTLLPSLEWFRNALHDVGFGRIRVEEFTPDERLLPKDAERELRSSAECATPQGGEGDFEAFWKEAGDIVAQEGRVYSKVLLLTCVKQ